MDVYCKHCGEPCCTDEFHEAENGSWKDWMAAFRAFGCSAVDAMFDGDSPEDVKEKCKSEASVDDGTLEGLGVIAELLGDDVDGCASMQEDFMDGLFF